MFMINNCIDLAISYWNYFASFNIFVKKLCLVLREIQVTTVNAFEVTFKSTMDIYCIKEALNGATF